MPLESSLAVNQSRDKNICELRNKLEEGENKFYELREDLVYRKSQCGRLLFYVPTSMISNVIRTCHDDLGHVGLNKVIDNLTKVYWFPNMKETVRNYIGNCLKCIQYSLPNGRLEGHLHSIEKGNRPFQTVHVDHYGPLGKTGRGFKYIFNIVDGFTKFIKLYPCKTT